MYALLFFTLWWISGFASANLFWWLSSSKGACYKVSNLCWTSFFGIGGIVTFVFTSILILAGFLSLWHEKLSRASIFDKVIYRK